MGIENRFPLTPEKSRALRAGCNCKNTENMLSYHALGDIGGRGVGTVALVQLVAALTSAVLRMRFLSCWKEI